MSDRQLHETECVLDINTNHEHDTEYADKMVVFDWDDGEGVMRELHIRHQDWVDMGEPDHLTVNIKPKDD